MGDRDSSPPSSTLTPDSSAVNAQSIRQKTDPAWVHVTEAKSNDGKRLLICNFCEKVIKGGGIHKMKKHLAGQKGDVGVGGKNYPSNQGLPRGKSNVFILPNYTLPRVKLNIW